MSVFSEEVKVKAALVGLPDNVAARIERRFLTRHEGEAGRFEVTSYSSIEKCDEAIRNKNVTAICIALGTFDPDKLVAFIGNTRVTHSLIPFCLVGTTNDHELYGVHKNWRQRFNHYFKIYTDHHAFEDYIGVTRDLFVADAIKTRALRHYETTPGRMLDIPRTTPPGVWIQGAFTVAGAIVAAGLGAVITFVLTRMYDHCPL